jgi:Flp pilus assembly protein TadG
MMSKPIVTAQRKGLTIIYMAVILAVLVGMVSLAVDYGRVQLAKTELRRGADAAARYGARFILMGQSAAFSAAAQAAADNLVDSSPLVLQSSDVTVGYWNSATRAFTANGTPRNAIRVSAERSSARGNAVSLYFGSIVGRSNFDVSAYSIVVAYPSSFVGLNGISFKNNAFIGSYNSSITTNPTQATANANAFVGTNGYLGEQNNGVLKGTAILGPAGSIDPLMIVTGGTIKLANPIPTPTEPAWTPTGNPGSIPAIWTCNTATTLPGGTYWFTSLTINANLNFTGPATVYVNGNIIHGGYALTAYNSIPANLKIYQIGANRTFEATSGSSGSITASIVAPRSDFISKNNLKFCGDCIFNSMDSMNNAEFFYDEALGSVGTISTVR